MDYSKVNDSELLCMIQEASLEAKDVLFLKYRYIIDIEVKKYLAMANLLGYDYNDLYQDALVGFADALNSYKEDGKAALPSFISLCVDRRLQVAIRKAGRIKNKILNDSLSLEHPYNQFAIPLMDILSDHSKNDPLQNILKEEDLKELMRSIEEALSDNEKEVYSFMVSGFKYNDIAVLLNKSSKQIDNTMQRIKIKIRKILEERH